ncbi:OLC1v1029495C1 [Oldenlandia corymbosa var. corymbosa]|uniref:OLC1v1029495C1 n=1 Tax=Oldenlandia corymbosa var. corymbosa TaxID=529605 RepID=A0AAV1CGY9_OLDCO|nr:OLC1v1029495C1 [Oldenlandia corymbosa var. corymbosa]
MELLNFPQELANHRHFLANLASFTSLAASSRNYHQRPVKAWKFQLLLGARNVPFYLIEQPFVPEQENQDNGDPICIHCSHADWGGHFVSTKSYHFILPPEGFWNQKMIKLDRQTYTRNYLLHGVIHSSGYGHIIGVQAGGTLTEGDLREFWVRICNFLHPTLISWEGHANQIIRRPYTPYNGNSEEIWFKLILQSQFADEESPCKPQGIYVQVPVDSNVGQLKKAVQEAIREAYAVCRNFNLSSIEDCVGQVDSTLVSDCLQSGNIVVKGANISPEVRFRYQGGTKRLACTCGARYYNARMRVFLCAQCRKYHHCLCYHESESNPVPKRCLPCNMRHILRRGEDINEPFESELIEHHLLPEDYLKDLSGKLE